MTERVSKNNELDSVRIFSRINFFHILWRSRWLSRRPATYASIWRKLGPASTVRGSTHDFTAAEKCIRAPGGMSDDEFIYEIIAGGGRFNVAAVRREICGTPPVPGMSLFF